MERIVQNLVNGRNSRRVTQKETQFKGTWVCLLLNLESSTNPRPKDREEGRELLYVCERGAGREDTGSR